MQKKTHIIIAAVIVFLILLWSISNLIHGVQTIDRDGDGFSDNEEEKIGTDPMDEDSDNDGINDYEEYNFWKSLSEKYSDESYSPNGDVDNDGIPNILDDDSDNDGLSDGDEIEYWNNRYEDEQMESLKPDGDIDHDGIPNILDEDSDNDGLSDGDEIDLGTDPSDPDTDGDGIPDGKDNTPAGPQNPSDLTYGGSDITPTTGPSRNGYHTDPTCIAVFDPYLAGRKRLEVYDAINGDYTAYVSDNSLSKIELSDKKYENVFTGIINLELSYKYIRIPSVAPNAKIHSYSIYPNTNLDFYKDGADNYYVKSSRSYGEAILTFTTSADSSYYTFYIPASLTLDDIKDEKITPPSSVIAKANTVIEKLGLTGEKNLKKIVNTLYDYFSSFTPGDIPSEDEEPDSYLAMALYQHGCCYVRSFACFVTANSIGIPTRLVKNECHAFVEMYIPNEGWMEVQLGGCGGSTSNPNEYDPFSNGNKPGDGDSDGDGDGDGNGDGDGGDIVWPWGDGDGSEKCSPDLLNTTTTISHVSSNASKLGYFNVEGYVRDMSQTGLPDLYVLIFVTKDKIIPGYLTGVGQTDDSGWFFIQCTVPNEASVGKNHVIAHALSTDTYCGSWTDPIINISSNTTLSLDMVQSVGLWDDLEIKGILFDDGEELLSYKKINIYRNGSYIGYINTNGQGEFYYPYRINTFGNFEISAVFNGDEYLGSSQDSQTVVVRDMRTSLEMDDITLTAVKRGDQLSIQGKLTDGSGSALPDSQIVIYYDIEKVSTTTTSSEGTFEKTINVQTDSSLGNITVRTQYPGNETFAEANAEEIIFVQSETQLTITSPSKTNLEQNETIIIGGTLKDNIGQPVENVLIRINWDLYSGDVRTSSDGTFDVTYNISSTAALGPSTIEADFDGNNIYLSSYDSKDVKIVPSGYVEEQKPQDEAQNIYWFILIAVLIIIIVVGVIMMFKKQRNQEGPSIQEIASHTISDLKTDGDYRKSVMNCYKEMCNWLSHQGVHKGSFQTPREFAMATKNFLKISPEGLYTLTQIFEKARYSKHEIGIEDRDKAIKCLNEIVSNPVNIPVNPQSVGNPTENTKEMNPNSYP